MTHCIFNSLSSLCYFFFFQAEDGIRVGRVTGVQTWALPISLAACADAEVADPAGTHPHKRDSRRGSSEERRVGKGVDLGGRRILKKKKITESLVDGERSQSKSFSSCARIG